MGRTGQLAMTFIDCKIAGNGENDKFRRRFNGQRMLQGVFGVQMILSLSH